MVEVTFQEYYTLTRDSLERGNSCRYTYTVCIEISVIMYS